MESVWTRSALALASATSRVQGIQVFEKQPTGRDVRRFLGRVLRKAKAKPRALVVDKGRQFWCRGFKSWCRGRKIKPRFGGGKGDILLF